MNMGMPEPEASILAFQPTISLVQLPARDGAFGDFCGLNVMRQFPTIRRTEAYMQNVLFKTSEPTTAEGMVEFYIVSLSLRNMDEKVSVVQEMHGWWNNSTRRATLDREFASPPEAFASFSDAIDRYCEMRINRAKAGFVHSFAWDGFLGDPSNYKKIDLPAARYRTSNGSSE